MHAVTECKLVSTVFYCLVFIAVGDFNLIHAKRYAVLQKSIEADLHPKGFILKLNHYLAE